MFWTKVAQFGPPGTPQKSAFFQESGRKRMKEWHQVTFTKEWMNALDDTRILAPTHFQNLVSFPRYSRLKKKCWYKLICNGTYWLLLTGHFGLVFIRPSQWSITAVRWCQTKTKTIHGGSPLTTDSWGQANSSSSEIAKNISVHCYYLGAESGWIITEIEIQV